MTNKNKNKYKTAHHKKNKEQFKTNQKDKIKDKSGLKNMKMNNSANSNNPVLIQETEAIMIQEKPIVQYESKPNTGHIIDN